MSLKPKGSFQMRIWKLKIEDPNKSYFKSEYKGHIKIQNPQQIYIEIWNPRQTKAEIQGPKNLY